MNYTHELIKAISKEVFSATSYPLYADYKKQKATFPCFTISINETKQRQELNERYFRENMCSITYYPNSRMECTNEELNAISEALYWALEYIEIGEQKLRYSDFKAHIVEGILTITVSYDFFLLKARLRGQCMETLQQYQGVKDDE